MSDTSSDDKLGLIPNRSDFRRTQIKEITDQIRNKFDTLIRGAVNADERRALKKQRELEVADQTSALIREDEADTPDCL